MTKSWEKGDSDIIGYVKREAARTGREFKEILDEMLAQAKRARDTKARMDVQKSQKFLKERNQRKRR